MAPQLKIIVELNVEIIPVCLKQQQKLFLTVGTVKTLMINTSNILSSFSNESG
jgi:hypothetical protein